MKPVENMSRSHSTPKAKQQKMFFFRTIRFFALFIVTKNETVPQMYIIAIIVLIEVAVFSYLLKWA